MVPLRASSKEIGGPDKDAPLPISLSLPLNTLSRSSKPKHLTPTLTTILNVIDDLILFCRGDLESIRIIKLGLDLFGCMSGLCINNGKSNVYFGGVLAETRNQILTLLDIPPDNLPMKYLGLPMGSKKLSSGKEAGNKNLVAWQRVCSPKRLGGLGLKEILSWNKESIGRSLFEIDQEKPSLWCSWINEHYLKNKSIWETITDEQDNWSWTGRLSLQLRTNFWNSKSPLNSLHFGLVLQDGSLQPL
ncbi:hypothetical protein V2J09_018410 [Rumex salicifolius]